MLTEGNKKACPLCGQYHDDEIRVIKDTVVIKGVKVEYDTKQHYCVAEDEYFSFAGEENENLARARAAYKQAIEN